MICFLVLLMTFFLLEVDLIYYQAMWSNGMYLFAHKPEEFSHFENYKHCIQHYIYIYICRYIRKTLYSYNLCCCVDILLTVVVKVSGLDYLKCSSYSFSLSLGSNVRSHSCLLRSICFWFFLKAIIGTFGWALLEVL